MASSLRPTHFHVNTDMKAFRKHHKHALVDNPLDYWLKEGYAYLTPTLVPGQALLESAEQNNRKGYRDHLREMQKGSVIYAYESMTGEGYVAAGVVAEAWDEQTRSGRPELFMDEHERYYRICVEWDLQFRCSVAELKQAGFTPRLSAVMAIKDESLIEFLSARRK
jgi:hypothetical protein